jgi:hypothetical protein
MSHVDVSSSNDCCDEYPEILIEDVHDRRRHAFINVCNGPDRYMRTLCIPV